jgi:superfamily II DNA or RNA helicase
MIDEIPADDFSLVIVDEAHHAYAPSYHKVIKHFQPKLRCGMTATVDRMDKFDVRDLFGSPLYSYPLTKALAHGGYLANIDYRVMVEKVNEDNIRHLRQRIIHGDGMVTLKMINQGVFLHAEFEPIAEIVRQEQRKGNKKTIVFCHSIAHIQEFERLFPEGKAYHTQVPPHILEARLEAFRKGTLRMIFVRDMFNEAMDIPDAELVVFLRSTASKTIWLQQLGRGLRTSAGKNQVTVLDFVANCQRLMSVYGLAEEVEKLEMEEFRHHQRAKKGIEVTYSHEMQKILDLIKLLRQRFYPTWAEASRAARALGFRSMDDYRANFSQDPRLPPSPVRFYSEEWNAKGGWKGFLGVTTTEMLKRKREQRVINRTPFTYEEAARFIQQYGFRDEKIYAKYFRSMSLRLPEFPQIVYKDVWEKNGGWEGFLTKNKPQTNDVPQKKNIILKRKEG